MDRRARGRDAEALARRHLRAHGLEILCENYRCRLGELDLVALDGKVLVVAEVRLRTHAGYGGAIESVDWAKRRRIVRATQHLLLARPELHRFPIRFDVLALSSTAQPAADIQWIKGAFEAPA